MSAKPKYNSTQASKVVYILYAEAGIVAVFTSRKKLEYFRESLGVKAEQFSVVEITTDTYAPTRKTYTLTP
jgi:hypothetical protein